MFTTVGWAGGAGIAVGMIVAISIIPTVAVQWRGPKWRL